MTAIKHDHSTKVVDHEWQPFSGLTQVAAEMQKTIKTSGMLLL